MARSWAMAVCDQMTSFTEGRQRTGKLIRLPPRLEPLHDVSVPDELPVYDFSARGSVRRRLACFIGRDVVDGILVGLSHERLPPASNHATTEVGLQQHKC